MIVEDQDGVPHACACVLSLVVRFGNPQSLTYRTGSEFSAKDAAMFPSTRRKRPSAVLQSTLESSCKADWSYCTMSKVQ